MSEQQDQERLAAPDGSFALVLWLLLLIATTTGCHERKPKSLKLTKDEAEWMEIQRIERERAADPEWEKHEIEAIRRDLEKQDQEHDLHARVLDWRLREGRRYDRAFREASKQALSVK